VAFDGLSESLREKRLDEGDKKKWYIKMSIIEIARGCASMLT